MLIQRVGVAFDFHPLAAAGDHREDRASSRDDPHVVLQLGHVFLGGRFLRERPRQHEFRFEYGGACLDTAVDGHPPNRWVSDQPLDVRDDLTAIRLIPPPIKFLGNDPELDNEVAGQVLGLDLAALDSRRACDGVCSERGRYPTRGLKEDFAVPLRPTGAFCRNERSFDPEPCIQASLELFRRIIGP